MAQCTATAKHTGEQCRAPAIKGKDKCRIHGGMTPVKHGRYSKYKDQLFAERREQLEKAEDLLQIEPQIALLRAMQEKFLEDLAVTGVVNERSSERILDFSKEITRQIEKVKRLEVEASIPKAIELTVERLVQIINVNVNDAAIRERIIAALDKADIGEIEGDRGW